MGIDSKLEGFLKVVSNLPYYITTPVIMNMLNPGYHGTCWYSWFRRRL